MKRITTIREVFDMVNARARGNTAVIPGSSSSAVLPSAGSRRERRRLEHEQRQAAAKATGKARP
jgi:hypothetical protein